ncbi:MAG: HlyD family efflux transporter periplasmic adaptor subunit [Fibrobacter sp.]|nr:HlyD family efflux transporter periplasmic adaptor subunit [Fibrobacter sp.]
MNKLEDLLNNFWNTHKSNAGVAYVYTHKLSLAWLLCVVVAVVLGVVYQGKVAMFQGIAEASETIISAPAATEIVKIHVVSGQEVQPGDTIIELNRPDLEMRLAELNRELDAIEGRSSLGTAEIDQKVAQIKADAASRSSSLRFEINRLETEYKKNKEISSKLKSLSSSKSSSDGNDAMAMQIKSLKNELALVQKSANEQIALLRGSGRLQKSAGKSEAETLRKELEALQKEKEELTVVSKDNWVVGDVNVRDGEKVSSFTPVVTLTRKSPTLVRGYINERVYQRMNLGEAVKVTTLSGTGKAVVGEVVGLSSRIVPFPTRMWKMPEMPIYGREVTIKIPEENPFLLGEMVSIAETSVKNLKKNQKNKSK